MQEATALRIVTDEAAPGKQKPLFEEIICKAPDGRRAGATVLHRPIGFGESGILQAEKILRPSFDLPVVVELVGSDDEIKASPPRTILL